MSEEDPPAKRMRLGGDGLVEPTREELMAENKKQESYIATLLSKLDGSACGTGAQNDLEERLKHQHAEASRKEKVLLMQLTRKEQELQEIATQLGELTKGNTPGPSQLRSALLDPALNILFQRMRHQLDEKSKKLQQATDDMAAWQFTPDSQTGKRLMSKCRTLIQENQELGKQVSTGRTAQLEAELALQKKYSEELKASQDELNEFVIQLDEEVEGMQSTICALQQQLKEAKEELATVKTRQAEPRTPEQSASEQQQVHKQAAQKERTSPMQQVEAPESLVSEPGPAPATPCSPSRSPPPGAAAAGNRTPSEEMSFAAPAAGEGADDVKDHRTWSADGSPTPPLAEEEGGGPGVDDRTADGTPLSRREEEKERTTPEQQQEDHERTTKMSREQVRTFSYKEMETQERRQQGEEEEEEEMAYQVTGQDLKDSLHGEHPEQQEVSREWYGEQPAPQEGQQQQQPEAAEEKMEIDSSRFENDSSSTESEGYSVDVQQSKSTGELTSPVASLEVSKTPTGDDSDEGFSTMTPDQGSTEPSAHYRGLDQTQGDTRNLNESSLDTKYSVEPSGCVDLGVVDSASSGQGTEGSSTREVEGPSTNTEPPVTSQTEGDDSSTSPTQVTLPDGQGLSQSALMPLLSEVKVTAKKLPHNCSLSVVDYDTGSSEEDDCAGEADNGGFVEEPTPPANKSSLPPETNHSPVSQSPESPHQNLSAEYSSPTSPANNSENIGSGVSPLKTLPVPMPPGNLDSDAGLLTAPNEPKDLTYIGENGTEPVHNNEQVATASE